MTRSYVGEQFERETGSASTADNAFAIPVTRSALNALISGNTIVLNQQYLITDEQRRIVVGSGANTVREHVVGNVALTITKHTHPPSSPTSADLWVDMN